MADASAASSDQKAAVPGAAADQSANIAAPDPKKPTMAVKVYAPFKEYFDGDAYSVSAENATGPFDILPQHHNFLCMLVPCTITLRTPYDEKPISIKINKALMNVKADRVVVFVDV